MKQLAPVVLFVYDRPEHTRKMLESLMANELASESELFIYADGPKENASENQKKRINEVRNIIKSGKWFNKTYLFDAEFNKGLANSIISGVTEVIDKYGKAIILEDDLVTSKYFLKFMNEALTQYEKNENIISISGYVYPVKEKLPNTFFIKGADCWGWATWKRGWDLFEINGKMLLEQLNKKKLTIEFDYNLSYPFTKMLQSQIEGKNDSWAIRWYASAFIKNGLTLYPGYSLVQNIGTDGSGSNFQNRTDDYEVKLTNRPVILTNIPFEENSVARGYFENYFRTIGAHKKNQEEYSKR